MPHGKSTAEMIAPSAYPQMMGRADAARALKTLRGDHTRERARKAMSAAIAPMRAAILEYVDALETAAAGSADIYDTVHEIRGFAETAGLPITGRIAEGLCRYLDTMERNGKPHDAAVTALHVAAIIRAARAGDADIRMGDMVVDELTALVSRRLAETGCV